MIFIKAESTILFRNKFSLTSCVQSCYLVKQVSQNFHYKITNIKDTDTIKLHQLICDINKLKFTLPQL